MTPDFTYTPPTTPLDILHVDSALLVVNKPSGLLSVPGRAEAHRDCLITRLQVVHPEALLIHRLDMDTSGLMIFARSKPAQRHISKQFENRQISKTYNARVTGHPPKNSGIVDLPLIVDWPNRPLQVVDHARGKQAITRWRVLSRGDNTSLMELIPETGRSHQLRVHMKALGHPIIGDRFYAPKNIAKLSPRLLLHAEKIALIQPDSGAGVTFHCPHLF
ncbi:MAG: RluA family pseudouridine synthase [Rhodobacteraceae bacterium]|nr:RluA family pseudouridine synthase [Paracoccaceae bacterium]